MNPRRIYIVSFSWRFLTKRFTAENFCNFVLDLTVETFWNFFQMIYCWHFLKIVFKGFTAKINRLLQLEFYILQITQCFFQKKIFNCPKHYASPKQVVKTGSHRGREFAVSEFHVEVFFLMIAVQSIPV